MRERGRERNSEWGRERNKERSRLNYARKGYVQHDAMTITTQWGKGRSKNGRDALDIYSFYFTQFPKDMGGKDLWFEFKKWGDVMKVFIAKNRNMSG